MMRKMILCLLASVVAYAAAAQENSAAGERSEWLPSFGAVNVSGDFDIAFVRVPDTEAPKITYDTRGSYTTKFKAEVKEKVLYVSERVDSRRPERTKITVRYNSLTEISISNAAAIFEGTLTGTMVDLVLGADASMTATLDVKDLKMELSGNSTAILSGKVRYFELLASKGKVSAFDLEVMSARVNAQNGASVSLWATDRLEAVTSTKGHVSYKGAPQIIRGGSKFLGGEILPVEQK